VQQDGILEQKRSKFSANEYATIELWKHDIKVFYFTHLWFVSYSLLKIKHTDVFTQRGFGKRSEGLGSIKVISLQSWVGCLQVC
jgi:hypothetical protein